MDDLIASTGVSYRKRAGVVITYNGGGDFFLVGSRFGVSGSNARALLHMQRRSIDRRKPSL